MKKQNLTSDLFDSGLVEKGDLSEIKAFKDKRKKTYTKAYNKEYLKDKKAKTLVFTKVEYDRLSDLAEKYNMPEATFIKACIFAYLDSSFVTPDKESIKSISHLLMTIKNSVNQSVQYVHMNQNVTYEDIQALGQQIADLEAFITSTLSNPPRLSVWLRQQFNQNENFYAELLQALSHHLSTEK